MAEVDPNITNGTCYFEADQEANEVYSPCGNAALGHLSCCQLGDACYDYNVCVTVADFTYTYLAGCTDPSYSDSHCPNKANYSDYQWTGLVKCSGTTGEQPWAACDNDGSETVKQSSKSENCHCDSDEDGLVLVVPALVASGTLPAEKLQSITWLAGMAPSVSSVDASSTTSTSTSSKTSASPESTSSFSSNSTSAGATISSSSWRTFTTSTTTAAPAASSSAVATSGLSSMSTSAKAGVGVAIAILSLATLACIIFGLKKLFDRRKDRNSNPGGKSNSEKPLEPTLANVRDPSGELCSPAWSGHKSELPGSLIFPENTNPNTPIDSASTIVPSPSWSSQQSLTKTQQELALYRPFRYQPNTNLEGIQELPDHERPRWAQTGYGTYGPDRGTNVEHERRMAKGEVHEMPA